MLVVYSKIMLSIERILASLARLDFTTEGMSLTFNRLSIIIADLKTDISAVSHVFQGLQR